MHKKLTLPSLLVIAGVLLSACTPPNPPTPELDLSSSTTQSNTSQATSVSNKPKMQGDSMKTIQDFTKIEASQVTLHTSKGDITFEVYGEKVPLTVQNFLNLAESGFYDGIVFHRVIEDFMAQAGDPLTKQPGAEAMWGTGGPGYAIADEFDPTLTHNDAGIVSMANSGPNSGGSQFFITYAATPWLDGKHAVFGKVTSGMDVLEQITIGDTIQKVSYK
jgi:cyclophilin family peptidyl-prolyl cis-trans isomerase